jgi:peroxiredoxin
VTVDGGDADHLRRGMAIPSITLPASDGSAVDIASICGVSIVAIYPWTGRPGHPNPLHWDEIPGAHGSTPELEGFRDVFPAIAAMGVSLFGLSRQTTAWQSEMAGRLGLPFPVLSDAEGRFSAALGLPSFATGGEIYLTRLTLVVLDGRLETVFHPVGKPAAHASEVLAWLKQRD